MAQKKPIVLNSSGKLEQLQSGDFLAEVNLPTATNANAGTMTAGMVAYITTTSGSINMARANAIGTMEAEGFVVADIAAGATGSYQDSGNLTLTTGQWDAVVESGSGGLVAGTDYFVSEATAGKIKTTPPVTGFVQCVGTGISATEMKIHIQPSVKL